jgi:ssDNA-binding Zn-finger/Zn-ribbon topoisomerase 1
LVVRNGQYGTFYGCPNYPKCRYTLHRWNRNYRVHAKWQNTRLYIFGCKIGCWFCNLLISSVVCGMDGCRTKMPIICPSIFYDSIKIKSNV